MKFSERYGYTPVRDAIQIESMDDPLRNSLWSLLQTLCWGYVDDSYDDLDGQPTLSSYSNMEFKSLCESLWINLFKLPLDRIGNDPGHVLGKLRGHFYDYEWFEVYDFVEFVANNYRRHRFKDEFIKSCNIVFEKEMSGYRFVDGKITQITDPQEIAEIEQAAEKSAGPVATHLQRSLELLSDRNTPDYRNSIKESISAVEACVRVAIGVDKGTLGQLLTRLEDEIGLHPALKTSFSKLYGYTSDEGGIRHALMDSEDVDFHDAKFMLVVCSAFINFVEGKIHVD